MTEKLKFIAAVESAGARKEAESNLEELSYQYNQSKDTKTNKNVMQKYLLLLVLLMIIFFGMISNYKKKFERTEKIFSSVELMKE